MGRSRLKRYNYFFNGLTWRAIPVRFEEIRQGFPRASPTARRIARVLAWSFWTAYFVFVLLVLSLRYGVLPHVENYRPAIERMIGKSIGQKVSIGRVEAGWDGLHPELTLYDVSVADAEGRPALSFLRVETVLSWWSVAGMRLHLRLLRIEAPTLHVRRGGDGRLFIAGIPLAQNGGGEGGGGGGISSWVLGQRRIRIDGATLVWEDELRGAPPLVMEDVNIAIDNDGRRHRFGFTARPPGDLASRIDVRGDFRGSGFAAPGNWRGQAFAEIGYVDLAAWGRWVDYPIALPRGRGAARVWLSLAGGRVREVTSDVSLQDLSFKFAGELPLLALENLSGRLQASFPDGGLAVRGHRVALSSAAADGPERIRIDPTDFELEWRKSGAGGIGSAGVSHLDLGVLARLAAHLPFDARWRQWLAEFAPRGRLDAFTAQWSGDAENPRIDSLKTGVRDLGLRARGDFPGFSGLSGTLAIDETGGRAIVRSGASSIDLPGVFPESPIRLDSLDAEVAWKSDRGQWTVELAQAGFAGPEAAGSAKGRYRTTDDGPGVIELDAALTRADARAVWRYMPHVVDKSARDWLRDSLLAGKAAETRLTLRGDLKDFPFPDRRLGQFLVTLKAHDVVLDYGQGWPRIDGLQGDLRFEGKGMTIEAQRGRILGARLSGMQARVPDFDVPVPILHVKGQAEGPTAEFLKFIEKSPVAEAIDRLTEDMRAAGDGRLDLDLVIPLDERRLGESKVAGAYRFTDNEVTVDAALPPLRQVNGSLRFSSHELSVPGIDASLFGGPLKIRGGLQQDGRMLITADGTADIGRLRRQSGHPALAGLSGAAAYHGEIRIDGRDADLTVESDLVGLASVLPEPFAKAGSRALPMRFERKFLDAARDQIDLSLGTILKARIVRRKTSGGFVPENGAVAIGRPLSLPGKGLSLGVSARRLDLDAWSRLIGSASSGEEKLASAWLPDAVEVEADEIIVRGTSWNEVDLAAASSGEQWKIRVDSPRATGDILWNGAGDGRLVARLDRLDIDRLSPSETNEGEPARLPALDVVAGDFSVRQMKFGRLEMRASNDGADWNLERIKASNPHGSLTGKGVWRHGDGAGRMQLSFALDSGDVGGLLGRLGYPGTVRAGTAHLDGQLAWNGASTEIDHASMQGNLKLEATKGQFLKLDPGAAGKLLSLISLQNLPRRISLDFKDVFSEGLAFDAINGQVAVQNGVMRTDRLHIDSPSAQVLMHGEVDLVRETQRLEVTVQPEIGDTAAVGMAMVNPAAGAFTWLANKMLRNPLGAMFSYRYRITGTWDDPKVEKLNAPAAVNTPPDGTS
jgi:uncharacterized protein (TIGR02099 family)